MKAHAPPAHRTQAAHAIASNLEGSRNQTELTLTCFVSISGGLFCAVERHGAALRQVLLPNRIRRQAGLASCVSSSFDTMIAMELRQAVQCGCWLCTVRLQDNVHQSLSYQSMTIQVAFSEGRIRVQVCADEQNN